MLLEDKNAVIYGAVLVATVLAVFKPWGRIRKRRAPKRDAL